MSANFPQLISRLKRVKPGQPLQDAVTSDLLNAMMETLEALVRGDNVVSGANVRKQSGPGFVMLSAKPLVPQAGEPEQRHPFEYYKSPYLGTPPAPADQWRKFRVRLGTVGGYAPMNINQEFTLTASSVTWVWVKANFSMVEMTSYSLPQLASCEINKGTTIPAETIEEGSTPAASYLLSEYVYGDGTNRNDTRTPHVRSQVPA